MKIKMRLERMEEKQKACLHRLAEMAIIFFYYFIVLCGADRYWLIYYCHNYY